TISTRKVTSFSSSSSSSAPAAAAAAPDARSEPAMTLSSSPLAMMAAMLVAPAYSVVNLNNSSNNHTQPGNGRFRINGLNGNDNITVNAATSGGDFLDGGNGNDTLNAAGSDDILDGGDGSDTL